MSRILLVPCLLALAAAFAAAPAVAKVEGTTSVTVNMTEFKFALSKKVVPRGIVVFGVVNRGQIIHDFEISGKKTPFYEAGKSGVLRVMFKKPGRYSFICTVPAHADLGMKGVLRVL